MVGDGGLADIDYMDEFKIWTTDPTNFPTSQVAQFVDTLHAQHRKVVLIVDPGVKVCVCMWDNWLPPPPPGSHQSVTRGLPWLP